MVNIFITGATGFVGGATLVRLLADPRVDRVVALVRASDSAHAQHRIAASLARFDAPGQDYLIDLAYSPDGRYLLGMNTERTRHHVWDLWKLRRQLRELKLDWEDDPPPNDEEKVVPITVKITSPSWWGPILGPLPLSK